MKWATRQRGFTIVELLIVIVVIAILAAITIVAYNGIQNRSKQSALQNELTQAVKALESKKIIGGSSYPATLADAGIKSTKLTYRYNARTDRYCIDAKDGSVEYSIRTSLQKPVEGACILQGMTLWLPLNGSVADISGNENVVTAQSGPTLTVGADGRSNGAYHFDGNNQLLVVTGADAIPAQTERVTISVWAKGTAAAGTDYGYIIHRGNTNSIGASVFFLGTNSGAAQNLVASADGQYGSGNTGVSSVPEAWHHLVLVYGGGYQTTYVDGVQRTDTNIGPMENAVTGTTFTIGGGPGGYRDYSGDIDDVRVYGRALTSAEVTQLFAAGAQ